jgi:hypothetical protein
MNTQGLGKSELMTRANGGQLKDSSALAFTKVLNTLENPPVLIFIFGLFFSHPRGIPLTWLVESLSFRFVLFETIDSSPKLLAVERTTAPVWQRVYFIEKAAQGHVKSLLGSSLEADVQVWEVRPLFNPFERSLIRVARRTLQA